MVIKHRIGFIAGFHSAAVKVNKDGKYISIGKIDVKRLLRQLAIGVVDIF